MPLGTEQNHAAGDIRAAVALVNAMQLDDEDALELEWDSDYEMYEARSPDGDVTFYALETYTAEQFPTPVDPVLEQSNWLIFDEHPYGA